MTNVPAPALTTTDTSNVPALKPNPTLRQRIFSTLSDPSSSSLAYFISFYFDGLAALSMVTMCAETVTMFSQTPAQQSMWRAFEMIITGNFLCDFILKLVTAPNILQYVTKRPVFWVDLLGLAPFFAECLFAILSSNGLVDSSMSIKSLRVLRLLRFFRLSRIAYENFPDVRMFIQAIRRSKLAIAFLGMYVFGAGLFFAACIYFSETSVCSLNTQDNIWYYLEDPKAACQIQDMFQSWWYTLVTMTTVGYGDIQVRSSGARIFSALVMICSLIFLALPSAIFAANLTEMYLERRLTREHHQSHGHHKKNESLLSRRPASPIRDAEVDDKERATISNGQETSSESDEELESLLLSLQSATDQVNSAMSSLNTHMTFIQYQQTQLESLLRKRR